jgi:hypothetical protein
MRAGCRYDGHWPRPGAPGSWFHGPAPLGDRPRTPPSITEERLRPAGGRIPTAHDLPGAPVRARRHAGIRPPDLTADAPEVGPRALPGCGRGC